MDMDDDEIEYEPDKLNLEVSAINELLFTRPHIRSSLIVWRLIRRQPLYQEKAKSRLILFFVWRITSLHHLDRCRQRSDWR